MEYASHTHSDDRYLLIDDSFDDQSDIIVIVADTGNYRPSRRYDGDPT